MPLKLERQNEVVRKQKGDGQVHFNKSEESPPALRSPGVDFHVQVLWFDWTLDENPSEREQLLRSGNYFSELKEMCKEKPCWRSLTNRKLSN